MHCDVEAVHSRARALPCRPNGAGKTSLLRVLAGLWPLTEGAVACPKSGVLWLPQVPFLVSGSLREQLCYPAMAGFQRRFDDRILECLQAVGLGKLAESPAGLDLVRTSGYRAHYARTTHAARASQTYEEWDGILSGGERQRLGFARLLYHAPRFAVLDEATSAINPDEEGRLYEKLTAAGVTYVSIAHRLELRKYHSVELVLKGDGTGAWELRNLK